jgi:hypothetical protein
MKTALLFCVLSLPLAATAQKLKATAPPRVYYVGKEKAPLYHTQADTAKKTGFFLQPEAEATVVGQFSPHWLIVKREGFLFLTPANMLIDPASPGQAPKLLDGTELPFDATTHQIAYQGVVEVAGATKEQLYTRAYEWLAKAYRSANDVIQMQDKEAGRLVGKGTASVRARGLSAGYVRHTLTIYLKDGRYKYVLTDFVHESGGMKDVYSGGPLESPKAEILPFGGKKPWDEVRRDADGDARRLVTDLQAALTLKGVKDPSDF